MIFGNKFVYLELQKSGSTHTRYILKKLPKQQIRVVGRKHNVYHSLTAKEKQEFDSKIKIGNVRNPWDWYVSLWAFGCEHRGGIYTRTVIRPDIRSFYKLPQFFRIFINHINRSSKWKELYSDNENTENFKKWLKMVLVEDPLGVGYYFYYSSSFKYVGLLSYEYFRLYSYFFNQNARSLTSYDAMVNYCEENYLIDIMVPNEKIIPTLINNADKICSGVEELNFAISSRPKRSNPSKRKDFRSYYDDESKAIVTEREKYIINKYKYTFDTEA